LDVEKSGQASHGVGILERRTPMKENVERLRLELGPELEKELEWLMAKWGLDRDATVGRIISDAARKARLEYREVGPGKGVE
jgi:hypothetical protein